MFIKITKSGNYKYYQAVKSSKQNGVVRHRVLFNLWRLDIIQGKPAFQNFVRRLLEILKVDSPLDIDSVSEAEMTH